MKSPLLILMALLFGLQSTAFAQPTQSKYIVQVAAYTESVSDSHFKDLGKLYLDKDCNDIHRYVTGVYYDRGSAEDMKEKAIDRGFKFARVIDMAEFERRRDIPCGNYNPYAHIPPAKTEATPEEGGTEYGDLTTIRAIFFDFNRANVRPDAKIELETVAKLLNKNKGYKVELHAHTDSKGSLAYNRALSARRRNAAKRFLINKGISSARIKGFSHGEGDPIAINATADGQDSEMGRQFNRRVTFVVRDSAGKVLDVVERIEIPEELRIK